MVDERNVSIQNTGWGQAFYQRTTNDGLLPYHLFHLLLGCAWTIDPERLVEPTKQAKIGQLKFLCLNKQKQWVRNWVQLMIETSIGPFNKNISNPYQSQWCFDEDELEGFARWDQCFGPECCWWHACRQTRPRFVFGGYWRWFVPHGHLDPSSVELNQSDKIQSQFRNCLKLKEKWGTGTWNAEINSSCHIWRTAIDNGEQVTVTYAYFHYLKLISTRIDSANDIRRVEDFHLSMGLNPIDMNMESWLNRWRLDFEFDYIGSLEFNLSIPTAQKTTARCQSSVEYLNIPSVTDIKTALDILNTQSIKLHWMPVLLSKKLQRKSGHSQKLQTN